MAKFRFILLLSVALMCSGYRWRCYAFCDEQTAIQNDYTEQRDECRGVAEDNVDAVMAKTSNPNSVKLRKTKLISLFSDCMAKYGWDVPKVNEKGKMAENDEIPIYESTVSKLAAKNGQDNVNNPNEADSKKVTEQDLPVRKTPVGNIQKQKDTNSNNSAANRTVNSKNQNDKAQASQTRDNKVKTENIPNQPATSKSKRSISNNQSPASKETTQQASSQSQKEPAVTNSTRKSVTNNTRNYTTNNVTRKPNEQQTTQPAAAQPQPVRNQPDYMRSANGRNSASQTPPESLPTYGRTAEPANGEHAKTPDDTNYTGETTNINNRSTNNSRSLQSRESVNGTGSSSDRPSRQDAVTYNSNGSPTPAANDDFSGNNANPPYATRTLNSANNTQAPENGRDSQMDGVLNGSRPSSDQDTAISSPGSISETAHNETKEKSATPTYSKKSSSTNNQQVISPDSSPRPAYLSKQPDNNTKQVNLPEDENFKGLNPSSARSGQNINESAENTVNYNSAETGTNINNPQTPYPAATTYDSEARQLSNNTPTGSQQMASSNPREPVNQITTERESVRETTNSQAINNTENPAAMTTATAPPPATAGVILPGQNESAIPSQPRVTKNNSAKQRASECQHARRSAGVSNAAAKKAKECDRECARLRKTLPNNINPAACPVKNSPVNMLDLQLGNRP